MSRDREKELERLNHQLAKHLAKKADERAEEAMTAKPIEIKGSKAMDVFSASVRRAGKSLSDFGAATGGLPSGLKTPKALKDFTGTWDFENIDDDLATGKEINMKTRYSKKQMGDALSPYIDKLDDAISTWTFVLMEPRKVTHKTDEGFGKLPLLGGEKFEGVGAYQGKRDGVIFQFEATGVKGLIEVNGADAFDTLEKFDDFVEATIGFNLHDEIDNMVERAEDEKRAKEVEEKREVYSDEFGSW